MAGDPILIKTSMIPQRLLLRIIERDREIFDRILHWWATCTAWSGAKMQDSSKHNAFLCVALQY